MNNSKIKMLKYLTLSTVLFGSFSGVVTSLEAALRVTPSPEATAYILWKNGFSPNEAERVSTDSLRVKLREGEKLAEDMFRNKWEKQENDPNGQEKISEGLNNAKEKLANVRQRILDNPDEDLTKELADAVISVAIHKKLKKRLKLKDRRVRLDAPLEDDDADVARDDDAAQPDDVAAPLEDDDARPDDYPNKKSGSFDIEGLTIGRANFQSKEKYNGNRQKNNSFSVEGLKVDRVSGHWEF
jgi:hypothetical protein